MSRAFTLVEILIVVVILGILAAVVTPQFASATTDAKKGATADQLDKIRNALAVYYVRNSSQFPPITAGTPADGAWGPLLDGVQYLRNAPMNMYVGGVNQDNGKKIILRDTPDTAFTTDYGWIYDPSTGKLWAAGYDAEDKPIPQTP